MDIFLNSLKKSVEHLQIIDEVFSQEKHPNQKVYLEIKKRILKLNSIDPDIEFTDSLYVGGKKGKGRKSYGRQMILSDIISYIFFYRGYMYTQEPGNEGSDQNDEQLYAKRRKAFIELLLQTINLLILIESTGVQSTVRKKLLKKLPETIGKSFFKEKEMKELHKALKAYNGDVGFPEAQLKNKEFNKKVQIIMKKLAMRGYKKPYDLLTDRQKASVDKETKDWKKLNEYYDSLLAKSGGGLWNELIVFFYLIRRTSVHIIPLLLTQRILSKDSMLKPPDYLVSHKGTMYGIEVGGGKSRQSSDFAEAMPSVNMVTTENTQVPPRCPLCGEFILFCPKVIEDCCDITENPLLRMRDEVHCVPECNLVKHDDIIKGKCPYVQYQGEMSKATLEKSKIEFTSNTDYHYHYSCIMKIQDKVALDKINEQYDMFTGKKLKADGKRYKQSSVNTLKTDYPYLSVSEFDDLTTDQIVCFGQYDMMQKKDPKNCKNCDFRKKCRKITEANKILSHPKDKNARIKLKKLLS